MSGHGGVLSHPNGTRTKLLKKGPFFYLHAVVYEGPAIPMGADGEADAAMEPEKPHEENE